MYKSNTLINECNLSINITKFQDQQIFLRINKNSVEACMSLQQPVESAQFREAEGLRGN